VRDAACPLSTRRGTRLVRLVRGKGGLRFPRVLAVFIERIVLPGAAPPPPLPPPSRTDWTRLVPPSVLTGHVNRLQARAEELARQVGALRAERDEALARATQEAQAREKVNAVAAAAARGTRRVRLVRGEGRGVST